MSQVLVFVTLAEGAVEFVGSDDDDGDPVDGSNGAGKIGSVPGGIVPGGSLGELFDCVELDGGAVEAAGGVKVSLNCRMKQSPRSA
jgi:hypothetical protein